MHKSADDQTRVCTTTLTVYAFISCAMFVINTRDGACPSYYKLHSRFEDLSTNLLFRLPDNRLDALKPFPLYKL